MERRGERLDDALHAMRPLWVVQNPKHQGPFSCFSDVAAYPRPVQRPTPPIIIGGESPAALRRAVTMGNGWYGFALTVEQAKRQIESLKQMAKQAERPAELGELEITVTPIGNLDQCSIEAYATAGVHRLVVLPKADATYSERHLPVLLDDILRNIDRLNGMGATTAI
jgi:alkanesulfonate monooxygenase SsuD/methylene tetrahydromethanopterin reductase-like flavin-dependent oxidoreductase (luciferase family)